MICRNFADIRAGSTHELAFGAVKSARSRSRQAKGIKARMAQFRPATILTSVLLVGAALTLGACGTTTYGTGTSAAKQTLQDVTGILSLGASKKGKEKIEYEARAPIVEPPATALPPPGSNPAATATAAGNWPVDPDEERERIRALVKERQEAGEEVTFAIPEQARPKPVLDPNRNKPKSEQFRRDIKASRQNNEQNQKMFDAAKKSKIGSFDAEGNPTRRYLIEPPTPYREADPESPVDITEKPKKKKGFKWSKLWPF